MHEIADKFNVSKSTVFFCRNKVTELLSNSSAQFIKWPQNAEEVKRTEEEFAKRAGFPGSINIKINEIIILYILNKLICIKFWFVHQLPSLITFEIH